MALSILPISLSTGVYVLLFIGFYDTLCGVMAQATLSAEIFLWRSSSAAVINRLSQIDRLLEPPPLVLPGSSFVKTTKVAVFSPLLMLTKASLRAP